MDLYLLDEKFEILKYADAVTSLCWNTKYYEIGDFELHIPFDRADADFPEILANVKYVCLSGSNYTGVNQSLTIQDNNCTIKGCFLEILLNSRVINNKYTNSGTAETVVRDIITKYIINPSDPRRKIPNIYLGDFQNLGEIVDYSHRGKHVDEVVGEILYTQELSYNLKYNFNDNKIHFNVFQGKDRTQSQNMNTWAVFSETYGNITPENEIYTYSNNYKNYAYVAGMGEGEARTIIIVDQTAPDEEIKELWVDAKDLQKEDNQSQVSYQNQLRTRGEQKLSEYQQKETAQFQITDYAAGDDYAVGDKCTYINKALNITAEGRITEINEVYESGVYRKSLILGEDQLTLTQKLRREKV